MTTIQSRGASTVGSSNGHRAANAPLLPTRHRPKGYAALAVALIVGCASLGLWLYTRAGARVPVVMAAHDIPAGHVIDRADLTTVRVGGQVTALAADHLESILGQTATVEILPNTLVQRAMVTAGSALSPSQALVGVAVAPGQIPSSGLRPGDHVEVLGLPAKSSLAANPSVLVTSASVFDVRDNPTTAGGSLLTLVVPRDAAAPVAAAGSNDLIALVVVGG